MTLAVILGGARSGKSALALELGCRWAGQVTFVATAEPRDEEMRKRVERHRRERPSEWQLIEEPRELASLSVWQRDDLVIVDCLTLWVSNLLGAKHDEEAIVAAAERLAAVAVARRPPTVIVTNEVGLGVVPTTPLGRQFRDLLGRVNGVLVARADTALFVVAGRALRLEPIAVEEMLA